MRDTRAHQLPAGTYFYDDLAVGDFFETGRVTITKEQIVAFASMSGDFFDVHLDDDFAREQGFPGRIAHGLLVLCLIDGLKNRAEAQLQAVASLGWQDWAFKAPVLPGDTIGAKITVEDTRLTSSGARGIIHLSFDVKNQHDVTVQAGRNALMMRRENKE